MHVNLKSKECDLFKYEVLILGFKYQYYFHINFKLTHLLVYCFTASHDIIIILHYFNRNGQPYLIDGKKKNILIRVMSKVRCVVR